MERDLKMPIVWYTSATRINLSNVRFVITLDSDTQLPLGTARRMIETLAHPLTSRALMLQEGSCRLLHHHPTAREPNPSEHDGLAFQPTLRRRGRD